MQALMLPSRPAAAIYAASSPSNPRLLVQFVRHTTSLSPNCLSRWILLLPSRLSLSPKPSFSSSSLYAAPLSTAPAGYPTVDEQSEAAKLAQYAGTMCDHCKNSGWLVCDFCQGEKTNVKSQNSRFYRRCPNCKAVGLILCPKCKVFKCVTFPDPSDGG